MDPLSQTIDLRDVEPAIDHRSRWLRFPVKVESQFEADNGVARCKHIITHNIVGLIIYHCFLFGDYRVVGDVFALDLFVHFAVVTPVMLGINLALTRHPPTWLREGLEMVGMVVLCATIIWVATASRLPNRDLVQLAIILVILFATIMQRLRFWYAVTTCLAAQVFYSHGLTTFAPFSMDRTIMSASVFMGTLLFSLFGAYTLEKEQRAAYLLQLRERLRNAELEIMSFRDSLTGLGNRRALASALKRIEESRSTAAPRSTSIVLLDIDHFKLFNDTNGHQKGDACLREIAALIAGCLREDRGVAYRFGGEEFLIVLDDATLDETLRVAERIRVAVGNARLPREADGRSFVSISAGVSAGYIGRDITADSLIAEADNALYAAKRNGRNRVSPARRRTDEAAIAALVEARMAS